MLILKSDLYLDQVLNGQRTASSLYFKVVKKALLLIQKIINDLLKVRVYFKFVRGDLKIKYDKSYFLFK